MIFSRTSRYLTKFTFRHLLINIKCFKNENFYNNIFDSADLTSMLHRSNIDVTKISHQRCYTELTLMLDCWCMLFIQDLVTKEWIFTTVKQMKITPMLNRFLYLIQPGPLESLLDLKVMVYHQCSNQPAHWGLSFEPNSTIPRGWDNWYTQIEDPEK